VFANVPLIAAYQIGAGSAGTGIAVVGPGVETVPVFVVVVVVVDQQEHRC
jgi:hypothetical protein